MKLAFVGEAWGEAEERERAPFVGPSGYLFNQLLSDAGIERHECLVTNVFNIRPRPTNDVVNLCGSRSEGIPGRGPLTKGKYVRAEYGPELLRLEAELTETRPNLVVALGGTATWALLGSGSITKVRGTIAAGFAGLKVLPTFHPAAILREYSYRHVTLLDLLKAKRQSEFPEIIRPKRTVYVEPSLQDIEEYFSETLLRAREICLDIETIGKQITCIGFAPTPAEAIVIPFWDKRQPDGNYWRTFEEERAAWAFVKAICELPCRKSGQNGMYDLNFLWSQYGIAVRNYADDTMLLHHAMLPEMQKGLGFLGSVYTDEASWKFMRTSTTAKKADL